MADLETVDLNGKVGVVTGGSYGIGRAVGVGLARSGADVILVARTREMLEESKERIEQEGTTCHVVEADIQNEEDIQKIAQTVEGEYGELHVLFNGASAIPDPEGSFRNAETETLLENCNTTFRGSILVTKYLLPHLQTAENADLIFITSDWALRGSGGPPTFSAAKAGVRAFSHNVKQELLQDGIRTTCLTPGDIASFDEKWEVPKWDVDDSVDEVEDELGKNRIPLSSVVNTVLRVVGDNQLTLYDEIQLSPTSPDYTHTQ